MNSYILLFIQGFPAVSSLAVYIAGKRSKKAADIIMIAALLIEFGVICTCFGIVQKSEMSIQLPYLMGYGLYMKLDMLRYIFVFMSGFIWMIAGIYSAGHIDPDGRANRFHACFMVTLSAVMGVFISENLLNLFTFFEMMALASYVLVVHSENDDAHEAGKLYIMVSIVSGMASLMGIFMLYVHTGELQIGRLPEMASHMGGIKYVSAILMSMGFAAKACMFPLHIWLSKTYSNSPAPATVVLSGVMAKTGVYGIMVISFIVNWDESFSIFLLAISSASMLIGGFLAMSNTEIKKILAYSSKTLIHHGIAELDMGFWTYAIESVFFISSSFAVAYSLKLYSAIFSYPACKSKGKGLSKKYKLYIPFAMTLLAMACISAVPDSINQLIQLGSARMFLESSIISFEFYKLEYFKASAQVIIIGFFIYKIFEKSGCIKEMGGALVYTNILDNWSKYMNETSAFIHRIMYKAFGSAFGFIDGFLEKIIQGAFYLFRRICKKHIKSKILQNGENECYEICEISRLILIRMESITYSVFVTAAIFIAAVSVLFMK